ncbi:NAD(P)H-binding protein [Natronosporangium hydrolyticum]|uniref:NAD(P)H-binding protein n=1 Tax=Natronosporangium hydrolyticum TaxID=2811111 RepID=A0A895Y654_9ACTN|nr:NAD(P)H-binding protein [Natronosporangium hydrolyticum]QSB12861.1 NAD(P)H-binding protein [Natronosporangium hydrolyticum]
MNLAEPTPDPGLIGVTGATGGVGGRVARRLAAAGARQRLVVRDLTRAPDLPGAEAVQASYEDLPGMRQALAEVDTLLLVSASEHPDRVALHRTAVDAAVVTGVTRVVYLSFLAAAADATFTFARDHWHTEQYLRGTGLPCTFLRDSLYQDVLPYFPDRAGVIRGPAGDGRFAPVARDDVAAVAATVLLAGDGRHDGQSYDLTGPELLTMAAVAAELSRATGRDISYHPETLPEAYESRARFGAPEWEVTGWVTSYAAIAAGELDLLADDVARVTGRPPTRFADYLAAGA